MGGNQEDLRRLMREKMSTPGSERQSPYAKVSSSGKIICTLCPGISIKSWATHQISAQHKRNVNAQKAAKAMPPPPPLARPVPPKNVLDPPKIAPKSILKNPLKAITITTGGEHSKAVESNESLKRPAQFPEEHPEAKVARVSVEGQHSRTTDPCPTIDKSAASSSEQPENGNGAPLPEGFFDDPKLDAKARNIEYRDPQEVQWEMFQKELREEGVKSEQVVENDEENETREMELEETDSMISNWEAVRGLEIRKDQKKKVEVNDDELQMEDDDEAEFAEFLDWRQKAVQ